MVKRLTPAEIASPARLTQRAAELGLPGARSRTAIIELRRSRAARAPLRHARSVNERLVERLTRRYTAEIARRGGETSIEQGAKASALRRKPLALVDRRDGLVVLHVDGWRYYSRRVGSRSAALSYLCGVDDAGPWAVRVPGTIIAVDDALTWVTPAEVIKARESGRRVLRQGDIYAIETTQRYDTPSGWVGEDVRTDPDTGETVTSHWWSAWKRQLVHHPADGRKHKPLDVPYPVRFVQQRTLAPGRGSGWGAGD